MVRSYQKIDELQHRSYKIKEFSTTTGSEVRRLKAQVELFWPKEIRCYRYHGLNDGMTILECGSGPGFLLEKFMEEFPNSAVTGVEIDPYLVDIAKKNLTEKGYKHFRVVEGSIMETGFPENSFDFVFSRLVLEHLPDPAGAVAEIFRVLKPGGKAVVVDNDFEMHLHTYPDIPELKDLYDAYCTSRRKEGGNPRIGRELPGILQNTGFSNVELEIVGAHSKIVGDELFLKSEGVGISSQLVKDGFLKSETLDTLAMKWNELLKLKDHAFYRQLFVAVGEKQLHPSKPVTITERPRSKKLSSILTVETLLPLEVAGRKEMILQYICELIAGALDIELAKISGETSVDELGFDSLAAVDIQACIRDDIGVAISIADIFEKQTINRISDFILEKFKKTVSVDTTTIEGNTDRRRHERDKEAVIWEEGEI